jgi:hypothetical protein
VTSCRGIFVDGMVVYGINLLCKRIDRTYGILRTSTPAPLCDAELRLRAKIQYLVCTLNAKRPRGMMSLDVMIHYFFLYRIHMIFKPKLAAAMSFPSCYNSQTNFF